MEIDELKDKYKSVLEEMNKLKIALCINEKKDKLSKLEAIVCSDDFYNDNEKSSKVLSEIKNLSIDVKKYEDVYNILMDSGAYIDLGIEENDNESIKEAKKLIDLVEYKREKLEINALLSDEYDKSNAILTIHPGAGGTESQDWAEMLYRMYLKWASKNEYDIEVLDYQMGDEAGIKSVSFLVKGSNSYGYLKCEKGVHRLVRISPFDSNSRRHTSFASVEVMPEIDDNISIDIKSEDLEVDTFRASGAGGQHVNKTDSAIRIKHVPTGIVVSCQTERSQIQNREYAMKMLKSKLYQYEKKKREELEKGIKGETLDNAFGSQIRSYVFCPYTLVKDHRTGFEIGNVNSVMDGKIDEFIYEYLKYISKNGIM